MHNLAYRIKLTRLQNGLSQANLAQKTKLTQQMISKLEGGHSHSTSAIFAIANALCVSAEWLWLGGDNRQPVTSFDDSPALIKAWRNLTEQQRNSITNQILDLGKKTSIKKNPGDHLE